MRFRYVGEAPDGSIEQYGYRFTPGQETDVSDEGAIRKLSGNRFFVAAGESVEDVPAPKRRGRPPKAAEPARDE
jgi:hypothetical protein